MSAKEVGPQTILELRTKNVKRIVAVEITPEGEVVVIGGNNGQGKSSTLDSIVYGLKGKKSFPDGVVRRGTDEAEIDIRTQNFHIKRTVDAGGRAHLDLRRDGVPIKKAPQSVLNELCEGISFDPESFSKMPTEKQSEHLRKLVKLDLSGIDNEIERLFGDRKDANSEYQRLKGKLDGFTFYPGLPQQEKTVNDLLEELSNINQHNSIHREKLRQLQDLRGKRKQIEQRVNFYNEALEKLKQEIAKHEEDIRLGEKDLDDIVEQGLALKQEVASFEPRSTDEVTGKLKTIEETNTKIRSNRQRAEIEMQVLRAKKKAENLTKELEGARAEKQRRITSVEMPVQGLSFDDKGRVTFNGTIFSECSSAERLRVAVSIAIKSNPNLPVMLIRDGSLLDQSNLKMVAEMAKEAGAQVWIERVVTDEDGAIIIEDGAVLQK
jgi:DNA repair exonuclease SbcCD ATPase subunit